MPSPIPICVFDLNSTLAFLRNAARASTYCRYTTVEWKPSDEWLGRALGYGSAVVVETASARQIQDAWATAYEWNVLEWLNRLPLGPLQAKLYLDELEAKYQQNTAFINGLYSKSRDINQGIVNQMNIGIRRTTVVKVLADVAISLIPGPAVISLAYGIAGEVIKEWNKVPSAKVVAVSVAKETAKDVLKDELEDGIERGAKGLERLAETHRETLAKSCQKLDQYRQIAVDAMKANNRGKANWAAQKMNLALGRAKAADVCATQAGRAATVVKQVGYFAKGISVAFVLKGAYDELSECWEDTKAAN
jgi:hypothetical protein